jgi:hypothetical protein
VKGFYDDVVELSAEDRAKLSRAPFDIEEYKEFLDIKEVKGEAGYSSLERTGIRPCLDVNGIWGGYIGEGAKTVLPSVAHAKISMRLVPNQDSATITKLFTETIGVAPQAGMKYYLECWWLDTETGFTGESMWISAICKEGSTAYNEPYVSRARITQDDVAEDSSGEGLDFELSPGSVLAAASGKFNDMIPCSYLYLKVENPPEDIRYGHHCFLARTFPGTRYDSRYQVQYRDLYPDFGGPYSKLSVSCRAGGVGDGFEIFGTCAIG